MLVKTLMLANRVSSCFLYCITLYNMDLYFAFIGLFGKKKLGIWKRYYIVKKSQVPCMKPRTETRNNRYMKYHYKLTYQLSFWNVSLKVDYHAEGKWFIHGPKCRKENQLLSLKHPCMIILSIAFKCGSWQHVQSVIRKAKSVDKNILGRWLKI